MIEYPIVDGDACPVDAEGVAAVDDDGAAQYMQACPARMELAFGQPWKELGGWKLEQFGSVADDQYLVQH